MAINPQELVLFRAYPELHAAVRKSVFFAKKATLAYFHTLDGKNAKAYFSCVYPAFLSSMFGKLITHQFIIAHNSSSDISPKEKSSNLSNGELGIGVSQIYFSNLVQGSSGPAKTNTPLPAVTSNINFSSDDRGEPGIGPITDKDWKALLAIAFTCYKLFQAGKLRTDGY